MGIEGRDRSRRAQLQRMLGELGLVLPYVSRAGGFYAAPGWYVELYDGGGLSPLLENAWRTSRGELYLGIDTPHAAATVQQIVFKIAGVHA